MFFTCKASSTMTAWFWLVSVLSLCRKSWRQLAMRISSWAMRCCCFFQFCEYLTIPASWRCIRAFFFSHGDRHGAADANDHRRRRRTWRSPGRYLRLPSQDGQGLNVHLHLKGDRPVLALSGDGDVLHGACESRLSQNSTHPIKGR